LQDKKKGDLREGERGQPGFRKEVLYLNWKPPHPPGKGVHIKEELFTKPRSLIGEIDRVGVEGPLFINFLQKKNSLKEVFLSKWEERRTLFFEVL